MAKAKSLLEQVRSEVPIRSGPPLWHTKLQASDPTRMEQIDQLIDGYHDNKLPGWSKAQIVKRIMAFGVPVKETALERYIETRREARNAKATH